MARLASLIAAVAGAAIAFTTGWILGYVLAPMEDPKPPTINIHNPPATARLAERCPVCGWHPTDGDFPEPSRGELLDDLARRVTKRLEHFHPDQPHAMPTPPVWTSEVEAAQGFPTDASRRRGEQV